LLPARSLTSLTSTGEEPQPRSVPAIDKITGPFTHHNLGIYLLHGKDTITGRHILTLNEAMEQKKIVVHETSNVRESLA
jgi:hypothetical protein